MESLMILLILLVCRGVLASSLQIIVANDGSGTYKTISEAISAALNRSTTQIKIFVKSGRYREHVIVPAWKSNIFLKGDGEIHTVIFSDSSHSKHIGTVDSATFGVDADGFVAEDITFSNTAGVYAGQAVAFRSAGDMTVLHRCTIGGYQDTLYSQRGRHFFRETTIYGTVDFIFGDSKAVLQNCKIYFRSPIRGQPDVLTAQGRESKDNSTGIVFQNCTLAADPLSPESPGGAYLGRPWRAFSRTVIMESFLDSVINKEGWLAWEHNNGSLSQVYYAEYHNRGPGNDTRGRLQCPGCKVVMDHREAEQFTVRNFLNGLDWTPSTGVPLFPDLIG